MTLTIELADDEAVALRDRAMAQGVTAEQYALQVLERELAPDWLRESWESAKRTGANSISMDDIDSEIAAARKARIYGRPKRGS
jgi:hypothetical protein